MKQVKIKLYKFEELDEKVQQSVIENLLCNNDFSDVYSYDYEKTLEEFEKLIGIKVYDWEVCSYRYFFRFKFNSDYPLLGSGGWDDKYDLYAEDVKGKYLYRWLMNNICGDIFPIRKFYKFESGWDKKKKRWNKQRYSKVLRSDWDCCPLTGCCYDCDILEPIVKYLSKPYNKSYDINDLINDCLDSFFTTWKNEIEYCNSEEYVREWIEGNESEEPTYLADGSVYHGQYEE